MDWPRQVEDYQKIIYWASNGLEFIIKDVVKFEEIVLPHYFRHNKMNSFVRQLNMYGFHKIKHNSFKSTFRHEHFQKGREYASAYPATSWSSSAANPRATIAIPMTRSQRRAGRSQTR